MTGRKNVLLIPEKRQDQSIFEHIFSKSFSIYLHFFDGLLEGKRNWKRHAPVSRVVSGNSSLMLA
jgi:hypothetical protein